MNLMTYEETVPLIQASIYHNLQFYSEDQVLQVIDALPDDPDGQLPEGANPDQHKANKQAQEQEAPLSSKEKNGLNKYKARYAHKRLYTVLPKYSKIQVLPGITSCRLMKYNKQAIELNSLLNK